MHDFQALSLTDKAFGCKQHSGFFKYLDYQTQKFDPMGDKVSQDLIKN